MKRTSFYLLIADGVSSFIINDNLSFVYDRPNGLREKLIPITPKILMFKGQLMI